MDPWVRQDKEPESAWRAFQAYRDAPARTLQSSGLPLADACKLAKEWAWVSRARAYDAHLDEVRIEARLDAIKVAERDTVHALTLAAHGGALVLANQIRGILARQAAGDGTAEVITTKDAVALGALVDRLWSKVHGEATETLAIQSMSLEDLRKLLGP